MPTKPMDQRERITRAVSVDGRGCWNWLLSKDRIGYGRVKIQQGTRDKFRMSSAHRYAYELWKGAIPDGLCVLHLCDNRGCCNPDHLWLGTQKENIQDMHKKGRGPKGYKRAAIDAAGRAG